MIAFHFMVTSSENRFPTDIIGLSFPESPPDNKVLTEWCGLVVGITPADIYTAIDEYTDPGSTVIKPVSRYSGFCRKVVDRGEDDIEADESEFSEESPLPYMEEMKDGWKSFREVFPTIRYCEDMEELDEDWYEKHSDWYEGVE